MEKFTSAPPNLEPITITLEDTEAIEAPATTSPDSEHGLDIDAIDRNISEFSYDEGADPTSLDGETPEASSQTVDSEHSEAYTAQSSEHETIPDANNLETAGVGVKGGAALAIAGIAAAIQIRRTLNHPSRFHGRGTRRERAANRRASDLEQHRAGAVDALERHQTPSRSAIPNPNRRYPRQNDPGYPQRFDPVQQFANTHRRRRLANPIQHDSFTPPPAVPASDARNERQERSQLRANLREDAANRRFARAEKLRQLYGNAIMGTKDELEDYIAQNDFPKKYVNSLRKAGKVARRNLRSTRRINDRLARQANSDDIPGLMTRASQRLRRD